MSGVQGIIWLVGFLTICVNHSYQEIPTFMYEKLSNQTNVRELIENMIMKDPKNENDPIFTQQGSVDPAVLEILEGSAAKPDICSPKLTSMEIPSDPDPNVCYFPACVAMPQCGGCGCINSMLECAPIKERVSLIQVMKMRYPYPGASKFSFEGLLEIPLTEHLQCACRCKTQPHHCHETKHVYLEHSCRCKCVNEDTEALNCPANKIWSNEECGCVCPKLHWCLEDEYFSNATCRCEMRSNYIKIIDQETIPINPASDLSRGPCAGVRCRPGFRPVIMGDYCQCRTSHVSGVQSGSIAGAVPRESVNQNTGDDSWQRVPDHPQYHHDRRPARPRRLRPGTPIRQTGVAVPTK